MGPPSLWSSLGGTGGARGMFGLFRLANFSSARVVICVSVYATSCLARRTNRASSCAENSTVTNLTQPGPLPDLDHLQRSTA